MPAPEAVDDLLATVGGTPTVRLQRLVDERDAAIYAKLEHLSPSGTIKDRVASAILDQAAAEGLLAPGGTVVESTEGNSGIALALACAVRGYKIILVVPEGLVGEKQMLLVVYGARMVLTPAEDGHAAAHRRADELARSIPGAFRPRLDTHPLVRELHQRTTAAELIAAATAGEVAIDGLVVGARTGVTLSAIGDVVRARFPHVRCVGVDGPTGNIELVERAPVPIDAATLVSVSDADAWAGRERLAQRQGILTGLPGGAVIHASMQLARELGRGKNVFAILGDSGDRCFSMIGGAG